MRQACLTMMVMAMGAGLAMGEEPAIEGPILTTSSTVEVLVATPDDAVVLASCKNCGGHKRHGDHQIVAACDSCRQAPCACKAKHFRHKPTRSEAAAAFNCCCQGSYKFPVPRQYTYHWPGMYSQQQMTAYSSPYRFPPLELPPGYGVGHPQKSQLATDSNPIQQTSAQQPVEVQQPRFERTSVKLKRMYNLK